MIETFEVESPNGEIRRFRLGPKRYWYDERWNLIIDVLNEESVKLPGNGYHFKMLYKAS